jgi:hypothetical protein
MAEDVGDATYSPHPATRARQAGERGDVATLLELLRSTERLNRIYAVANLGHTRDPRALAALIRCLSSPDHHLVVGALKALARIGDDSVRDDVFEVTRNADYAIVATAASTLVTLRDPRAQGLIVSTMARDDLPHSRWRVKWGITELVRLHATDAVADLERLKRRKGPLTRWRLRRAIKTLTTSAS